MVIDRPETMTNAHQEFGAFGNGMNPAEYNYQHFRADHLVADLQRTVGKSGIMPGEMAPDFELPRADGGTLRLSDLRGKPVLLHFGSFT